MSDRREPLDDAIDRVATAMTVTPADPSLADRIVPRLSPGAFPRPRWAIGLAAAAAVGFLAVWMRPDGGADLRVRMAQPVSAPLASRPVSDSGAVSRLAPTVGARPSTRPSGPRDEPLRVVHTEGGLPALAPPTALGIASIEEPSLPTVTALDVPSIDLQPLVVTDLSATPRSQE